MTILRLRAEVADERGRLSLLASAIAACRGNIFGIDVHVLDGVRVADEFTIGLPPGGSADALATALRRAGGAMIDVERVDAHELVDPVARAVDLAAGVAAGGDDQLEAGAARLVRADRARLVDVEVAGDARTLVVAVDGERRRRWLVVERDGPPFSSTEVARVAALVRLAAMASADARALAASTATRVGPPRPVRRRPATFFRHRAPALAPRA